jgi:predicted ABC-type ATPase
LPDQTEQARARAKVFLPTIEEIVNPDEIAREMLPDQPAEAAGRAGRAALERRRLLLEGTRSFAIETTLSGRTLLPFAMRAKQRGWRIGLLYVGLRSAATAIERVRNRVLLGGHDVPPLEVTRRYSRSLANISSFASIADHVLFVDNSPTRRPVLLLEVIGGRTTFRRRKLPAWLAENLPQSIREPRRR